MPFPMRIQPIDSIRIDAPKPPVFKSRLKRLFDRPFTGVLRISYGEKTVVGGEQDAGAAAEFEPSTACLDKMVQNFMEGNNEKKCSTSRCNCFNGNSNDSPDDEFGFFSDSHSSSSSLTDSSDGLKALIPCASAAERNLFADTSKIIEKNKTACKGKSDLRKIVTDGLSSLGYDASVCKSKWEKSSSLPAGGEHDYIDVIIAGGERIIIDVDFRSEFEIARPTSGYKSILQQLPYIFVGNPDRLRQIVSIAAEAARLSLKKKGMHIPPWRKPEYLKSKWLGTHTRISNPSNSPNDVASGSQPKPEPEVPDLSVIFREDRKSPPGLTWQLPALKAKGSKPAAVTGLASLLRESIK